MIIQYDTRSDASVDEKLRSLAHSIMLAFNEAGISTDNKVTTEAENINTIAAQIRQSSGAITVLENKVAVLEDKMIIPEAPAEDGAYVLTVTVTDGNPEYTWEAQE